MALLRAGVAIALVAAACGPRNDRPSSRPTQATQAQPPPTQDDPPLHLHPHPDVAPDEIGEASATPPMAPDAGTAPVVEACAPLPDPPRAKPPTRIQSGPPITNYIPPSVIMSPIRARARCLRACYQAGLAKNPALAGRVILKFVIDEDGWVRTVRVMDSELGDPTVEECLRQQLVGLRYAEPGGPGRVTVAYPIVFAPSESK